VSTNLVNRHSRNKLYSWAAVALLYAASAGLSGLEGFDASAAEPASRACDARLPHPLHRDEQSVRDAEHARLAAEMSGDTDTLTCLLDQHYTNLSFDGKTYG
jgi:hypothetical protein